MRVAREEGMQIAKGESERELVGQRFSLCSRGGVLCHPEERAGDVDCSYYNSAQCVARFRRVFGRFNSSVPLWPRASGLLCSASRKMWMRRMAMWTGLMMMIVGANIAVGGSCTVQNEIINMKQFF